MKFKKIVTAISLTILSATAYNVYAETPVDEPIVLRTMGSLLFGGTVSEAPNEETFHGDHGYAQYYIPAKSHTYPLIMWHGIGQSGRSYESTPDGREGYMAIMPRRGWSTYIVDQPRRGRAGYTMATGDKVNNPTILSERAVWEAFRNGTWRKGQPMTFFDNVLMARDSVTVDQFFRQQTPDTGVEPRDKATRDFHGRTMASLLAETGPAILITHSNSGQYGWSTAMNAPEGSLKAIVAYEPGACAFPESDCPDDIEASHIELVNETQAPQKVSDTDFQKLTKFPIIIVFGDNVKTEPGETFNEEVWRVAKHRAEQFVETVNRHGGDARLLHLPSIGIKGNTHAPFADLNNIEIADLLEKFLHEKGLDGFDNSYIGPKIAK